MQQLAKFIYFKLMGWKLVGSFPELDKCVFIVVPHTSNFDFLLGLLVRKVWRKEINYVGKKSLFRFPFGWFFRWTGGAPVDRTGGQDTVNSIISIFNERKRFRLALSPEGTRKSVDKWKSGFYYIAKGAQVPVVLCAFDYGEKQIKLSDPLYTTANKEADFKIYYNFFDGVQGKVRLHKND